jgi:acyl-CoA dehydrogenase
MILTPEQQEIQRLAREFAEKHIIPVAAEYDRTGEFPEFIIEAAKKADLLAMGIPKQFGGRALDAVTQGVILEELGYGCAGFATILGVNGLGYYAPLLAGHRGTEEVLFRSYCGGWFVGLRFDRTSRGLRCQRWQEHG